MIEMSITCPELDELDRLLGRADEMVLGVLRDCVERITLIGEREIASRTPVNKYTTGGTLRASIQSEVVSQPDGAVGFVGTAQSYACICDAITRVVTLNGEKSIGQLKVGDYVLTQAGTYRPVVAKTAFSACLKPDLVDIETYWRADRTHRLTVTEDHKVLAWRDGRNKWIMAGDLLPTDKLYVRKKVPSNKGRAKLNICIVCGKWHSGQGETYCSMQCRDKHWASGANPHIGRKRSAETCDRMRQATALRLRERPETHPQAVMNRKGVKTSHERDVESWLQRIGKPYKAEKYIGGLLVDFFVSSENLVVEADGAYWHSDQAKDIERDKRILGSIPGARILHIHFYDKRWSPELDCNPLPGVYYVSCNPGTDTFVDPEVFVAVPIISLRSWRYEPVGRTRRKMLYDLSIADIHSFLANGVLVSNSWVEEDTKPHEIRPRNKKALAFQSVAGFQLVYRTGANKSLSRKAVMGAAPGSYRTLRGRALYRMGSKSTPTRAKADTVLVKSVKHPGTKGQHFFRDGVKATEPQAQALMQARMRRLLVKLAGR